IIGGMASFLVAVFPSQARWWRLGPVLFLGLVGIWKPHSVDVRDIFNQTAEKILFTHRFRDSLESLSLNAKSRPTWPIVIDVDRAWDYEAVFTFNIWAAYKGIANPVVLRVAIPNEEHLSPFESELSRVMQTWASKGLRGHFVPFNEASDL